MDKAMHSEFEGHTPGPWKYIAGDNTTFPHVLIPMHYQLGGEKKFDRLTVNVGAGSDEIHEANAKLIAAAPDLLKENQSLRSELQKQKDYWKEVVNTYEAELQKQKELNAELVEMLRIILATESFKKKYPFTVKEIESLLKKSK